MKISWAVSWAGVAQRSSGKACGSRLTIVFRLFPDHQINSPEYKSSAADKFRNSWTATVLVDLAGQQYICSGVGHSEKRPDEATRAKKKSVTNAYRQLFASLALVVLHNGKVAVVPIDPDEDDEE